jgi:hypothetical protein
MHDMICVSPFPGLNSQTPDPALAFIPTLLRSQCSKIHLDDRTPGSPEPFKEALKY